MLNEQKQLDLVKPLTDMSISAGYWYKCWRNASAVSILAIGALIGTVVYYECIEKRKQKEEES